MLTVNLIGGLCNHLFQIAATIGQAHKTGVEFKFVNKFEFQGITSPWVYSKHFPNLAEHFCDGLGGPFKMYSEPHFHYTEIPATDNVKLNGYFQSEKYWDGDKELLKKYFSPSLHLMTGLFNKYKEIWTHPNLVSIHVRRGDYLTFEQHHANLSKTAYYDDALAIILNHNKHLSIRPIFLIFSDDIPFCKEVLTGVIPNTLFIEGNSNVEDLVLMARCQTHVIANSTFSWWAAYVGEIYYENRLTISPGKTYNWFGPLLKDNNTKDLIPERWLQL